MALAAQSTRARVKQYRQATPHAAQSPHMHTCSLQVVTVLLLIARLNYKRKTCVQSVVVCVREGSNEAWTRVREHRDAAQHPHQVS
jgi:hypothetical protein